MQAASAAGIHLLPYPQTNIPKRKTGKQTYAMWSAPHAGLRFGQTGIRISAALVSKAVEISSMGELTHEKDIANITERSRYGGIAQGTCRSRELHLCQPYGTQRHQKTQAPTWPLDIFPLFPSPNCKQSGEATCMAFAYGESNALPKSVNLLQRTPIKTADRQWKTHYEILDGDG